MEGTTVSCNYSYIDNGIQSARKRQSGPNEYPGSRERERIGARQACFTVCSSRVMFAVCAGSRTAHVIVRGLQTAHVT